MIPSAHYGREQGFQADGRDMTWSSGTTPPALRQTWPALGVSEACCPPGPLPSGVCQVDKQNRAGYSPIMLTALATLKTQHDLETVLQLFRLGDVNARASQVRALGAADRDNSSHLLSPGHTQAQGENPHSTGKETKAQRRIHFLKVKLEEGGT